MATLTGADHHRLWTSRSGRLASTARITEQADHARAYAQRVSEMTEAVMRSIAETAKAVANTCEDTAALLEEGAAHCADESRRMLLDQARQARCRAAHERDHARRLRG